MLCPECGQEVAVTVCTPIVAVETAHAVAELALAVHRAVSPDHPDVPTLAAIGEW